MAFTIDFLMKYQYTYTNGMGGGVAIRNIRYVVICCLILFVLMYPLSFSSIVAVHVALYALSPSSPAPRTLYLSLLLIPFSIIGLLKILGMVREATSPAFIAVVSWLGVSWVFAYRWGMVDGGVLIEIARYSLLFSLVFLAVLMVVSTTIYQKRYRVADNYITEVQRNRD